MKILQSSINYQNKQCDLNFEFWVLTGICRRENYSIFFPWKIFGHLEKSKQILQFDGKNIGKDKAYTNPKKSSKCWKIRENYLVFGARCCPSQPKSASSFAAQQLKRLLRLLSLVPVSHGVTTPVLKFSSSAHLQFLSLRLSCFSVSKNKCE